jgi:hypothetical protein
MPGERRSHNQDQQRQIVSRSLQVEPPTSTNTANDNNMSIEQVSFGAGQAQANSARPRIINQGHMKIYSDYNANIEIVNMPGSTMELAGASFKPSPNSNEQWQNPVTYTPNYPTYSVTTPPAENPIARYYCLSCKAKYFTQERLDQHVKEFPRYCSQCKACRKKDGPSGYNYCCVNRNNYPIYWVPGKGGAVKDG